MPVPTTAVRSLQQHILLSPARYSSSLNTVSGSNVNSQCTKSPVLYVRASPSEGCHSNNENLDKEGYKRVCFSVWYKNIDNYQLRCYHWPMLVKHTPVSVLVGSINTNIQTTYHSYCCHFYCARHPTMCKMSFIIIVLAHQDGRNRPAYIHRTRTRTLTHTYTGHVHVH